MSKLTVIDHRNLHKNEADLNSEKFNETFELSQFKLKLVLSALTSVCLLHSNENDSFPKAETSYFLLRIELNVYSVRHEGQNENYNI